MSERLNDLAAYLNDKLDADILESVVAYGELSITVKAGDIVDVVRFLRDDAKCQFVSIIDVSGADYPARAKRFDIVYHL
ncbi:MAG: NADH-quinone oxidoreductase subunit C, partial [Mesorhizobium sp.]|nr:NADH-quinone oxidoreductase subunit C [Mesorhizobium sp.]